MYIHLQILLDRHFIHLMSLENKKIKTGNALHGFLSAITWRHRKNLLYTSTFTFYLSNSQLQVSKIRRFSMAL